MRWVVQLSTGTDTGSCRGTKTLIVQKTLSYKKPRRTKQRPCNARPTVLFAQTFPFRTLRFQASHGEIIVLGIYRAMAGFIIRLKFDLAIWIKHTACLVQKLKSK